jgi:hypothetical protein
LFGCAPDLACASSSAVAVALLLSGLVARWTARERPFA